MTFLKTLFIAAASMLFVAAGVQAQTLSISGISDSYRPGQKMIAKVAYSNPTAKALLPTLLLTVIDARGNMWQKRWPVIADSFEVVMDLPDEMQSGYYAMQFKLLQNMATIKGIVVSPGKVRSLKTTLLNANGEVFEKEIVVQPDSSFVYTNVLFPDNAVLSFATTNGATDLNIQVQQAGDSVMANVDPVLKTVFVGMPQQMAAEPKQFTTIDQNDFPVRDIYTLEVVTVEASTKSAAEQYNEKYSTGLFKAFDERLLDPGKDGIGYQNILQYLTGRVAGLRINSFGFDASAIWRNSPVYFYVDEFRTDMSFVLSIPVTDIALVKAYPPPFFGNPGGSGGAIAIYTKRGGSLTNGNRTAFKVTGYSPFETSFLPPPPANEQP